MFACQLFWLLLICSDGVQRPESETEATEMFVLKNSVVLLFVLFIGVTHSF